MIRKALSVGALACLAAGVVQVTSAQNPLPPDPAPSCTLTAQQFAGWFQSGKATPNGAVKPANSLTFTPNSLCSFYQWSEQMFLWLTSPGEYGGSGRVFDSPTFYTLNNDGSLTRNRPGLERRFAVRSSQVGPRGKLLKVEANGTVTDTSTGQAGGSGTLLSQHQSLVYYTTMVNDVYAYFRTGSVFNNGQSVFNPPITTFPVNQAELTQVVNFAQQHGGKITDSDALALELKTSWVELDGIDASQYVTTTAEIDVYDFTKPAQPIPGSSPAITGWMPTGTKKAKLALVGMHVVGSVQGHPEMIWATFEHMNNAPNGTYSYKASNGMVKTVPLSTAPPPGGKWLFCADNASGTFNAELLTSPQSNPKAMPPVVVPPGAIKPSSGTQALSSNVVRSFAWGGATGAAGLENNTDLISLNNTVIGMLGAGDVRKNYAQIGAVWTGGQVPPSPPTPPPGPAAPIGSVMLSNATMETFHQTASQPFGFNCFSCHNGGNLSGLSHIWSGMKPLSLPAGK